MLFVRGCAILGYGHFSKGSDRVIRGGSWNSNARNVRAASRNRNDPGNADNNLGFRPLNSAFCLTSQRNAEQKNVRTAVNSCGKTENGPSRASSPGERSRRCRFSLRGFAEGD
ncbi:MAG: SUMF1/EgtB/PvdO family nonheme iron enzyme [Planctomycetaceae bacterium]